MAATVHIPDPKIIDVKSLLDLARHGDSIVIEDGGVSFELSRRRVGRTAKEILADTSLFHSAESLDEDWSEDLRNIIAERKTDYRDPWE